MTQPTSVEHVACVQDGRVRNLIIIPAGDPEGFVALISPQWQHVENVEALSPLPQVGWHWDGTNYIAPPTLVASPTSIPPDGATASTVTYTDHTPNAPTQVTFDVNGATTTEPVTNGVATIDVTSTTAGDRISVTCNGLAAGIEVTT